jgi:hypothetical protein
MRLRQLFEVSGRTVGIIFGRFNPPHQGHKAAWEMAAQNDHWFVGTNQSTQGPKDPLPYAIKTKAMLAIMPELKGHIVPETSWLTLASKVYKEYGDITLNVYTDEDWVTKTLIQYNGVEGPHGIYKFKHIDQRLTPRLSSATALRAAVQAGDRDAFARAAGVDADTPVAGKPFFDVVAHYLAPYAEKAKPVKKIKEPKQGAAEGAPIVVAQAPIDVRNPKKAPQSYRNQGDIVPDTKPPSTEKRGVKGRPGQRPMPKYDEGSSNAIADTAKRLANKDDGKVAKLRAAGDKRREEELKGRNIAKKNESLKHSLQELSNDMLGKYKKAAGADASKADKEGNVKRGDKRFSGIVKATNKQFANDAKDKK